MMPATYGEFMELVAELREAQLLSRRFETEESMKKLAELERRVDEAIAAGRPEPMRKEESDAD